MMMRSQHMLMNADIIFSNLVNPRTRHFHQTSTAYRSELERVNFQAYIWNQCLSPNLNLPLPENNGWLVSNGQLEISWMTKQTAPDTLLEFVQCKCKTGCETMRCSCLKTGLNCTDFCQCVNCQNGKEDDNSDEDDDESSDNFDSCCHINEEEYDD